MIIIMNIHYFFKKQMADRYLSTSDVENILSKPFRETLSDGENLDFCYCTLGERTRNDPLGLLLNFGLQKSTITHIDERYDRLKKVNVLMDGFEVIISTDRPELAAKINFRALGLNIDLIKYLG